jgi:phosphocarrier protein
MSAFTTSEVMICNAKGMHARASAAFVKCAQQFDAEITVSRCDDTVDGTSIMDLLLLAAAKGTIITITADGAEAPEAMKALVELVENGFYED